MKVFDFLCRSCKTIHEEWVDNEARFDEPGEPCPMCGGKTRSIPAPPKPKVATAAVSFERGSGKERPGPATMDTRAIADGRGNEFREKREKMWRDRDRAALRHRDKIRVR